MLWACFFSIPITHHALPFLASVTSRYFLEYVFWCIPSWLSSLHTIWMLYLCLSGKLLLFLRLYASVKFVYPPPPCPETRFSCTVQAGFNLLITYLRLAGTLATVADSSLYWPRQNWTQPSRGLCGTQLCLGTSHSTIPIDPAIWVFLKNVAYIYIISVPSRPGTAPYTQEGQFIFEYLKCFGQTLFLFKIRRFLCQFLLLIISWIQDLISKICDNLPLIEWECIDYLL